MKVIDVIIKYLGLISAHQHVSWRILTIHFSYNRTSIENDIVAEYRREDEQREQHADKVKDCCSSDADQMLIKCSSDADD